MAQHRVLSSGKPSTSGLSFQSLFEGSDVREDVEELLLFEMNKTLGKGKGAKGAKGKKKAKNSGNDVDKSNNSDVNAESDDIAYRVVETLVPLLSACFDKMFKKYVDEALSSIKRSVEAENEKTIQALTKQNTLLKYELDRQEQYSRRETIRVTGVPETADEDVEESLMKVLTDIGCEVNKGHISVIHRSGKKLQGSGKPRPILVKFVSRKAKASVMKKRANLKGTMHKNIFLNDDLTRLRSRMLSLAKQQEGVERVGTTPEGKIRCVLKKKVGQTQGQIVFLDTPDDLFHIGIDSPDLAALGIQPAA